MTLTLCCLTIWSTPKLLGRKCFIARVRLPVPQNNSIAKKPSSLRSSILLKLFAWESFCDSAKDLFLEDDGKAEGESWPALCHWRSL